MPDTSLVVMARYPEVGITKTRLARTIGDEEAVHLYQAFLSDLARRFAGQRYDLHWAYTAAEVNYLAFITTLAPSLIQHMHSFPQQGADLGARLLHVFRDIPMSTSIVAQMTIELAESQGLKVFTLENLFDIDELPDLLRLAQLLEADNTLAPATATCLATLKDLV